MKTAISRITIETVINGYTVTECPDYYRHDGVVCQPRVFQTLASLIEWLDDNLARPKEGEDSKADLTDSEAEALLDEAIRQAERPGL